MPSHPGSVRELFDKKARGWEAHYQDGGKLVPRLERFSSSLERLVEPPARVLDFGCGTGATARALAARGYAVVGCDISPEMLRVAQASSTEVSWVLTAPGALALPFEASCFDAVIAASVFEYLEDVEASARELSRVLTPNGILLASVPNPSHPIRRVEAAIQHLSRNALLRHATSRSTKVRNYLAYLSVSKNRPRLAGWVDVFRCSGMEGSGVPIQDTANLPLSMLCFKKTF